MNIGKQIRAIRQKKRMTQKKLAELIGREGSFVSHIERNSRNVSVRLLSQIAQALETAPMEFFITGKDDYEKSIEKMSTLNEESLHKLNDYIDFLHLTQNKEN